jgi:hypothetical protein
MLPLRKVATTTPTAASRGPRPQSLKLQQQTWDTIPIPHSTCVFSPPSDYGLPPTAASVGGYCHMPKSAVGAATSTM